MEIKPYYDKDGITIYNGDCLDVMGQFDDKLFDMVLTDLPYGTTRNKWDSVIPFEPMWKQLETVIKPSCAVVMTSQSLFTAQIIITSPFFRYCLIWEKTRAGGFLNASRMPLQAHEDITVHYKKLPAYNPQKEAGKPYIRKAVSNGDGRNYGKFDRKGTISVNTGDRFPRSVIKIPNDNHGSLHPAQKPVALMEYLIKTYTNKGDIVLDFTMGSGTTLVAAKKLGRKAVGIELSEKYCQIAVDRLEAIQPDFWSIK